MKIFYSYIVVFLFLISHAVPTLALEYSVGKVKVSVGKNGDGIISVRNDQLPPKSYKNKDAYLAWVWLAEEITGHSKPHMSKRLRALAKGQQFGPDLMIGRWYQLSVSKFNRVFGKRYIITNKQFLQLGKITIVRDPRVYQKRHVI